MQLYVRWLQFDIKEIPLAEWSENKSANSGGNYCNLIEYSVNRRMSL